MDLQLLGHNLEILPTVRAYVEKKLGKLNRHLPNIQSVKVELMEQKTKSTDQRYRVQVTMDVNHTLLRAEEQAENLLVAIDQVVPALDHQIERYKGKVYKKSKARISARNATQEVPVTGEVEAPRVVRIKRFPVNLMTVEDAIRQMELLGHDFFLFNNVETKELNLLYRREDGNYAVIEPELK